MIRRLMALAAVTVLGGCVGVVPGDFAYKGDAVIIAQPVPAISGQQYDDEESAVNWGARGGVMLPMGATEAVDARLTLGFYGRLLEDDAKRIEVGVDFTPDLANLDRQVMYFTFTGDFVGFIGESGLYWKAGGGGLFEMQGDNTYFLGLIEGGAGMWFPIGEEGGAVVLNVMLQFPLYKDLNVPAILTITGGYDF